MRKAVSVIILGIVSFGIYNLYFSRSQKTFAIIKQVKSGMNQQQVLGILSKPDTVYVWDTNSPQSPVVMEYDMGFGAPDALRVFLSHDSVTAVTYAQ